MMNSKAETAVALASELLSKVSRMTTPELEELDEATLDWTAEAWTHSSPLRARQVELVSELVSQLLALRHDTRRKL